MIVTVDKFREYVETDLVDAQIAERLAAVESLIRARTNNNFQKRNRRSAADIVDGAFVFDLPIFRKGETVEVSESKYNDGLYVIGQDFDLIDETGVLVTLVCYPPDVQMGAIDILKWKMQNEAQNSGEMTGAISSETISRHSVSYATDGTENNIDESMGVPKKLTAFLQTYEKARF